jgi:site-specific DNA-methyltransferase (adenine-specific)
MKPYYEQDGITIYHGDCREVLPNCDIADVVLTDPPYGIFDCGGKWGRKHDLQWDRVVFDSIDVVLAAGRNQVIWGGNYYALPPSRGWLVWFKRDSVPSAASVELAWTSYDMNSRIIDQTIAATNAERVGHPTQKPLRVMAWSLSFSVGARTVIDPFMGSGTTLRAAKDAGLCAVGIEIEERYCEIAAKRLSQGVLNLEAECLAG